MNASIPERPGWLRWLVVTSLALNLMLASALVVLVLRATRPPPEPAQSAMPVQSGLWREALRREFQTQRRQWLPDLLAARRARIQVATALRAEPFDSERLDAALASLREADGRVQARTQQALSELAAGMDAEQREWLARRIERSQLGRGIVPRP